MKYISKCLMFLCICLCMISSLKNVYANTYNEEYFSVINQDGSVELVPYEYNDGISLISDIELSSLEDITYGVARIKGYTTYTEYDGVKDKKSRSSYIHGQSANDAAYIGVVSNGTKVRVKLAGVYMDIPVANVEVKEYSSTTNVSYYMGSDGMLFHYYYTGSYGSTSKRESTLVGYTPDYLKDGVKYYSYDGHYFYTDYKKMLTDYKAGVNTYTNAINKNNPYYNYYQYLSFRAPTTLTKTQINKYLSKYTGPSTSRPNSKLYNQAEALLDNEKTYGVNVGLMLGIAINESGWGNSKYAVNYNNFFGLNVTDDGNSVPYSFDTPEECFNYFSSVVISKGYMYGGDSRYRGSHLGDKQSGVNVCYASDPYWGEKAAAFSYYMDMNAENKDYLNYDIAIAKVGEVNYYKDSALSTLLYSSGAEVSSGTNLNVYNVPFVVISETSKSYKIYSDTTLKSDRSDLNKNNTYNLSRDYVYIDKSNVFLTYETQQKNKMPFTDVYEGQWYYEYVDEAYKLGLMTGVTDTLFKPSANMNRGMVAIVFYRMEGSPKVSYSGVFPDVANNQYYTNAVIWAKQKGVINGYDNGTFKPLNNVTREEMATMIYRFAQYKGINVKSSKDISYFKDYKKITSYAKTPLQWSVDKGIMSGKDNGTRLDPQGLATRAEASKMLLNVYKLIK